MLGLVRWMQMGEKVLQLQVLPEEQVQTTERMPLEI
jgi:hypothetical protein